MSFLRNHWYDLGGLLAILVLTYLSLNHLALTTYQIILWASLLSLFLHQLEEYRIAGTFPGMINAVLYKSPTPDRYPLNTNTAFVVNVVVGWTSYFLAALFAERAVWLGIATMLVSVGNIVAHTTLFNLKGKTLYNAGLLTCWLLFAPCAWLLFSTIHKAHLVTATDYAIGIPLGIILNVSGHPKND